MTKEASSVSIQITIESKSKPTTPDAAEEPNEQSRLLAAYLKRLASASVEMELKRGESLELLCGHLLTAVTILSAVYISPAPALFEYLGDNPASASTGQLVLAWSYLFCLAPLFGALALTLLALIRRKVPTLASPGKQSEYIKELQKQMKDHEGAPSLDELALEMDYCISLDQQYTGLRQKYNRMWSLLRPALCLILISVIFALCSGFYLFVKFV